MLRFFLVLIFLHSFYAFAADKVDLCGNPGKKFSDEKILKDIKNKINQNRNAFSVKIPIKNLMENVLHFVRDNLCDKCPYERSNDDREDSQRCRNLVGDVTFALLSCDTENSKGVFPWLELACAKGNEFSKKNNGLNALATCSAYYANSPALADLCQKSAATHKSDDSNKDGWHFNDQMPPETQRKPGEKDNF